MPLSSPGYLPDSGIEPGFSELAGGFFTTEPPEKPNMIICVCVCVCVCVCACAHTHNKSLQLCPTLCDPVDRSPTDSFIQGIFQNTGVGCYGLLQGIFPTQGLNMCLLYLLHWEAGCLPLAPLRKQSMTMKTDKSENI